MIKRLQLRKLSNSSDAFRLAEMGPHKYVLDMTYPRQMLMPDGRTVPCFEISELYEDKNGDWICAWPQVDTYISLEQLMSEYIIEDSKADNYVKGLEEFKELSLKEASKNMNKGFDELYTILYDTKQENPVPVTDMDQEIENKINENERHTEDICALHSGESKANEEGPAE